MTQWIVTAILDRLLHHSMVINIRGNSYRLMGKLLKKRWQETKIRGKVAQFS
jgi:DNA replication protein DnaC